MTDGGSDCAREGGGVKKKKEKHGMSISVLIFPLKEKNQELLPQTILNSNQIQMRKQNVTVIRTCQA